MIKVHCAKNCDGDGLRCLSSNISQAGGIWFDLEEDTKDLEIGGKDGAGCLAGRRNHTANVQLQADVLLIRGQQVLRYEWEAEFEEDRLRT